MVRVQELDEEPGTLGILKPYEDYSQNKLDFYQSWRENILKRKQTISNLFSLVDKDTNVLV